MNDFEMIQLASARSHDFRREADQQRLARLANAHKVSTKASRKRTPGVPRSSLRLTLDHLLGRVHA
jgi:hypothetical protein